MTITLAREIQMVSEDVPDLHQRLFVSQKAHLILPTHRWIDQASELAKGKNKIGSTLRGLVHVIWIKQEEMVYV